MVRAPLVLVALAGLALPTFAQEVVVPIDDCAAETLFQALGLEDNPDCLIPGEEPGDDIVGEGEDVGEEESSKNPVSVAAKLPGNNREAALAHASEMSGGKAGGNGNNGGETNSGNGNGNGKGNGKS